MNEIATQHEAQSLTAVQIRAQVNLIQEVMNAVMKKDTHYGIIPGCQKPSLWKPGAEKLLVTFRIASEAVVEDLSTPDEARFRVTRRGTHINSGLFVGSGVGECSSNEEKYKWRFAVCDAEWDATPEDRRRLKYKRDGSTIKQVRTNPADMANTVLKMADKRGYVALALNTTAASDIFTQDIEDLPEGVDHGESAPEPIKPPARKSAPAAPVEGAQTATFIPADVSTKSAPDGKWTKYGVKSPEGVWYSTFDKTLGAMAEGAKNLGQAIVIGFVVDANGYKNIKTLEVKEDA